MRVSATPAPAFQDRIDLRGPSFLEPIIPPDAQETPRHRPRTTRRRGRRIDGPAGAPGGAVAAAVAGAAGIGRRVAVCAGRPTQRPSISASRRCGGEEEISAARSSVAPDSVVSCGGGPGRAGAGGRRPGGVAGAARSCSPTSRCASGCWRCTRRTPRGGPSPPSRAPSGGARAWPRSGRAEERGGRHRPVAGVRLPGQRCGTGRVLSSGPYCSGTGWS